LDFGKLKTEAARIDERAANRENGSNRKVFPKEAFYNLDQGEHDIRILPPGYEDVEYIPGGKIAMLVFDHNNVPGDVVNPKTGRKDKYRCPRATYPELGIPCPICAALSEMWEWFKAQGGAAAGQRWAGVLGGGGPPGQAARAVLLWIQAWAEHLRPQHRAVRWAARCLQAWKAQPRWLARLHLP
jgi:hypothetical protein